MGAAMRSRFITIPVLAPLKEDIPGIIISIACHVFPDAELNETDPSIQEAATIFYEKGANPRHIRAALNNALFLNGTLSPQAIYFTATDFCAPTDKYSSIYADLWAIRSCSSKSFFPWNGNLLSYPLPPHLQGVVESSTGDINETELSKRIEELKPYANV